MANGIEPINPVAIDLGVIEIRWYGLIIAVGILLALYMAVRESEKRGLAKDTFLDLILYAVPIAIISARIYYVIFQWDYYSQNLGEIIKIWNGGIAIHGALIGSVITAYVFTKVPTPCTVLA